jgi:hypothetical protein
MLLDNDTTSFQKYQKIEDDLKTILSKLVTKHEEVLGKDEKIDYKAYLVAPSEYLVSKYWDVHCSNLPNHLNKKAVILSHTNIDVDDVVMLSKKWSESILLLRADCLPKITSNSVKWSVKKELFDRFLDDSKKDHYNALKRFLDAYYELTKFENIEGLRYLPRITRNYTTNNLKLGTNPESFIVNNNY